MGLFGRIWNLGKGSLKTRGTGSAERISEAELQAELEGLGQVERAAVVAGEPAAEGVEAPLEEPERDAAGEVIKTL
jgi:hypothetical protein